MFTTRPQSSLSAQVAGTLHRWSGKSFTRVNNRLLNGVLTHFNAWALWRGLVSLCFCLPVRLKIVLVCLRRKMDGLWQPGAWGEVAPKHLGECARLRLYVCVCERGGVCVSVCVCVFVTLTPFCPRKPRERTLMGGGGRGSALMHFKTDRRERLQLKLRGQQPPHWKKAARILSQFPSQFSYFLFKSSFICRLQERIDFTFSIPWNSAWIFTSRILFFLKHLLHLSKLEDLQKVGPSKSPNKRRNFQCVTWPGLNPGPSGQCHTSTIIQDPCNFKPLTLYEPFSVFIHRQKCTIGRLRFRRESWLSNEWKIAGSNPAPSKPVCCVLGKIRSA